MSRAGSPRGRGDYRLWAYLSDPMPTEGPRRLLDQKETVDATAHAERRRIRRYIVDSGSALTDEGRGARLQAAIDELRTSGRRIALLVAAPSHLAATPLAARKAMASLLATGVVIKDASGELHPAAATVALAAAAVGATPRRRTQCDLERNDV